MDVGFRKLFKKQLKKLPKKIQEQFSVRLEVFIDNPFDPVLNNHRLSGKLKHLRSINVTGDVRAIYEQISGDKALFFMIGDHSELYD